MDDSPWLIMLKVATGALWYGTIWRLTAHLKEIAPEEWKNIGGASFHAKLPGILRVGSMKNAMTDLRLMIWTFTNAPMHLGDDETAILAWMSRGFLAMLIALVFVTPFFV